MKRNFRIQGKAIAKQSVKFTKSGFTYTPTEIVNYSNWVKLCFKNKYPEHNIELLENIPLKVI